MKSRRTRKAGIINIEILMIFRYYYCVLKNQATYTDTLALQQVKNKVIEAKEVFSSDSRPQLIIMKRCSVSNRGYPTRQPLSATGRFHSLYAKVKFPYNGSFVNSSFRLIGILSKETQHESDFSWRVCFVWRFGKNRGWSIPYLCKVDPLSTRVVWRKWSNDNKFRWTSNQNHLPKFC